MLQPLPAPNVTEESRPFWEGVEQGVLKFQRCTACNHAWLPARSECPACLSMKAEWCEASGRAHLVSWVVYHKPFNPAFAERVPYTVAIVALEEGPRLITNIVGTDDPEALVIDQPLALKIERDGEVTVPRFTPVAGAK